MWGNPSSLVVVDTSGRYGGESARCLSPAALVVLPVEDPIRGGDDERSAKAENKNRNSRDSELRKRGPRWRMRSISARDCARGGATAAGEAAPTGPPLAASWRATSALSARTCLRTSSRKSSARCGTRIWWAAMPRLRVTRWMTSNDPRLAASPRTLMRPKTWSQSTLIPRARDRGRIRDSPR